MSQAAVSPSFGIKAEETRRGSVIAQRRGADTMAEELMWNGTRLGLLAIGLRDTVHGGSAGGGGRGGGEGGALMGTRGLRST